VNDPRIEHILVPVDFLDMTDQAIEHGAFLARKFGASLTLLHVVHVPAIAEAGTWLDPVITPGIEQSMKEQMASLARKKLEELAGKCAGQGVEAGTAVREGAPSDEIIGMAEEEGVDLIVMGSQGRTGISHFLVGSVAERVVRRAPCNVLCIKPGPT
jgi:nucleotide-binding universal stress UspA family protein